MNVSFLSSEALSALQTEVASEAVVLSLQAHRDPKLDLSEAVSDLGCDPMNQWTLRALLPKALTSIDSLIEDCTLEILGDNLHRAGWRQWTESQQGAVENALRDIWCNLLQSQDNARRIRDFLTFRAMAGGRIAWYLETVGSTLLDTLLGRTESNTKEISVNNPWWAQRHAQLQELQDWAESQGCRIIVNTGR